MSIAQFKGIPSAFAQKQVHTSSKLVVAQRRAASSIPIVITANTCVVVSSCAATAAAISSRSSPVVNRRHCCAWATQNQQSEPIRGPADEAEDEEYEEGEYDEGEWEEYEEYEEGEEGKDGEEQVTAAVSTARQIPTDATSISFTPDDFVEVGLISRAHGVKGEVKVQLITDEPKKRLGTAGRRLWLLPPAGRGAAAAASSSNGILKRVTVQWGRVARPESRDRRSEWAVKLCEVTDRDQAATLAGFKLLLALCDREASPRGREEFFITDLVGLKAVDASSQQLIGIVTEVYDSSASYSLLRVRLAPNEEDISESRYRSVLVPFVKEIVPDVEIAGGVLQMSLPEGLLDTASSKKLRRPYTKEQQAQLRQQFKQRLQQL